MEGLLHHEDTLSEYFNVDTLWGFVIGTAADIRECVAHCHQGQFIAGSAILHHLLMMGVYNWTGEDIFQQGNFP